MVRSRPGSERRSRRRAASASGSSSPSGTRGAISAGRSANWAKSETIAGPAGGEHAQQRGGGLAGGGIAKVEAEVDGGDGRLEVLEGDEAGDVDAVRHSGPPRLSFKVHHRRRLAHDQQVDRLEPWRGEGSHGGDGPLDRGLEAEGAEHGAVEGEAEAAAQLPAGRLVRRRRQGDPHRHGPHRHADLLLVEKRRRPLAVDEHAALPPQQGAMGGEFEDGRVPPGVPALGERRGLAHPAVVAGEAGLVIPESARLVAAEGEVEQQVVEDDVVEGEHAGEAHGEIEHRDVIAVVPHLVERQPAIRAGLARSCHRPAPLDRGIDRLPFQADQPYVRQGREVGQEVEAVVRDPRADGRKGGDVVELHRGCLRAAAVACDLTLGPSPEGEGGLCRTVGARRVRCAHQDGP